VNDGSSVILAIVDVSGTGTLSGLRYQDGALPFGRRLLGRRTGPVRLKRRQKAGDTLGETPAGTIDALEGGGLRLSVPNTGDAVRLEQEGGGSFSNLDLHANDIVARNAAGQTAVEIDTTTARVTVGAVGVAGELHVKDGQGRETVLIDGANGNVVAGTQGVEGDILVRDASDRLVITLDGDDAAVVVGAQGNEGDLLVKDATGTNTIRLDGATGDVEFKGRLLDSAGSHGGIGHTSLQRLPELIGGGITALHRHTNSGNATRAVALPLNNNANMSETVLTITLPSRQRVFAFIAITSLVYQGALHPPGLAFAGIARVDGQPMPFPWPGYLLNSPVYSGLAQSIEFKLSSPYSFVESWAVAVVMPEG